MYVAYSAINQLQNLPQGKQQAEPQNELQLRYRAYQEACNKYGHEIAAIQKYLPGWEPKFSY